MGRRLVFREFGRCDGPATYLVPSRNNLADTDLELKGIASLHAGVKHLLGLDMN